MDRMPRFASKSGNKMNYGKISQNGLILKYDMQNPSSYTGSGTTITDLKASSTSTLFNTPVWSSGNTRYLSFNGTNQYFMTTTGLNNKLSPVNTSTVIAFFVWAYLSSNGVIVSEQGSSTADSGWFDSQIELVSGTIRFAVWPYTIGTPKLTSTISTSLNTWYYIGLVYDGTTLRGYINGQAAGTSTYARQTPYNDGGARNLYYTMAYKTSTNMGSAAYANMRFGAFHIYNRVPSSTEILTNYLRTKTIYGL